MLLQDVLINMLQSSVSCRAVNLEEEHGCVSVLIAVVKSTCSLSGSLQACSS